MGGAVPSLPQYAFMAWCSFRGSIGTTLPLPLPLHLIICCSSCHEIGPINELFWPHNYSGYYLFLSSNALYFCYH